MARISTALTFKDHLGACLARWGINRMHYMVPPGLYALGTPGAADPVVVTANYKMSYDIVRQALAGRNAWLLVLETFGINVWCAAGKGTFGTEELVRRIRRSGLSQVVEHRRLLLPVLGAPGVAAHEVAGQTGFSVSYATIRAADLPEYLDNGMHTTPAMREITFNWYERLVLIPVEVMLGLKPVFLMGGAIFLAFALLAGAPAGIAAFLGFVGAVFAGTAVAPAVLPLLPGRSFAVKGAFAGAVWSAIFFTMAGGSRLSAPSIAAIFLALPAISAFFTLNFTGCTPFTSRSGVRKELRLGLPVMGGALLASALLLLFARFA